VALEPLLSLLPLLPSLQVVRMLKLLQQQQQQQQQQKLRLCKLLFLLPIFFSSSQFPQLSLSFSMFSCLRFFLTLLSALSRVLQQYSTLRFRAKTNSSSYGTQISLSLSIKSSFLAQTHLFINLLFLFLLLHLHFHLSLLLLLPGQILFCTASSSLSNHSLNPLCKQKHKHKPTTKLTSQTSHQDV
jgi:hypothetical protein